MQSKNTILLSAVGKPRFGEISVMEGLLHSLSKQTPNERAQKAAYGFSLAELSHNEIRHRLPYAVLYFKSKSRQVAEAGRNQFLYSFKMKYFCSIGVICRREDEEVGGGRRERIRNVWLVIIVGAEEIDRYHGNVSMFIGRRYQDSICYRTAPYNWWRKLGS